MQIKTFLDNAFSILDQGHWPLTFIPPSEQKYSYQSSTPLDTIGLIHAAAYPMV